MGAVVDALRPRPTTRTVSTQALALALGAALNSTFGRWGSDFVRDACAAEDRLGRLHARVARLMASPLTLSETLRAVSALAGVDAHATAWACRAHLVAQLDAALHGPPAHAPALVLELVNNRWRASIDDFARHALNGGPPH
jgi:hypothetical protein